MNARKLTADQLGAKGEMRFAELCEDAGLIANKSSRDHMGWDYLVEVPLGAKEAGKPLDKRPAGPTCRVQVKTIWVGEKDRVALTLSAAERLVKPSEPAFVCVLVVDEESLGFADASLIHMVGENLRRILKRLREAEGDPTAKALNEQEITFGMGAGMPFPLTGQGVRDALVNACGDDAIAYRRNKEQALQDLGYETGRYELKVRFPASGIDEFIDFFLGLRPAEIEHAEANDVRFDVPVPAQEFPEPAPDGTQRLIFMPKPIGKCTIKVTGEAFGSPAVFTGEVFAPPPALVLPDDKQRLLYRTTSFSLDLRGDGRVLFSLLPDDSAEPRRQPLGGWLNHFRLLRLLGEKQTHFEITSEPPQLRHFVTLNVASQAAAIRDASVLEDACIAAEWLLDKGGVQSVYATGDEIAHDAPEIVTAYRRLKLSTGPSPALELPADVDAPDEVQMTLLLIGGVSIGIIKLGYGALLGYRGVRDGSNYALAEDTSAPVEVRQLTDLAQALEEFGSELATKMEPNAIAFLSLDEDRQSAAEDGDPEAAAEIPNEPH